MKKMSVVPSFADGRESELPLFFLDGLLPVDQALSVNSDCLVVSLVSTNSASANPILLQRPNSKCASCSPCWSPRTTVRMRSSTRASSIRTRGYSPGSFHFGETPKKSGILLCRRHDCTWSVPRHGARGERN